MDRLDERLRAMAEGETLPLPEAYEAAMDGLEEQVRRGALGETVRRRPVRRRALLAAALGIIACGICAAAAGRMGWLSPVVDYGDSEALMEEISVRVDQTAEGDHCDLTLESAVTDGRVIYCLFTGRYDEAFPDVDAVLEDTLLTTGSWANAVSCWRLDQGEEPGQFRFIASTGQMGEAMMPPESTEPGYLGREVELRVQILDDEAAGVMAPMETYYFTVRMNDTIPSREAVWPDGTRAVVTPLRAELTFTAEVDAWPAFADAAAYEDWNERILAELDPTFRFADGETFGPEDVLPEEIQRGTHGPGLDFMDLGDPTDPDGPRQIRCHLYLLAPRLLEAEQVAGLELGGEWYEFPAE